MKILKSKTGMAAAVILAAATLLIGLNTTPAWARGSVCYNGGNGNCLNNWNNGGIGSSIKIGAPNWPNEGFALHQLTTFCNNGFVSHTCPFTDQSLDDLFFNDALVDIAYAGSQGGCVGSGQNDTRTFLVVCPNSSGNNGGWGSIWIETALNSCGGSGTLRFANRHFTENNGHELVLRADSTATGSYADASSGTFDGQSCWG